MRPLHTITSRHARATRPTRFAWALVALLAWCASTRTAIAQISVVGSTVVERDAAPGERYEGSILVRNSSDKPKAVRIYKSDYAFFADGTSRFDPPGEMPRSNARWIEPAVSTLTIPGGSDVAVTYTVRVPLADSLRGTYWSALMIEGEVAPPVVNGARQIGLGAVIRYAVQIATNLQATGSRTVALSNQRLVTDSAGARALEVDVRNSGERAYRPSLWVELYDASGAQRAKVQQQRGLLYPGSSLRQHFAFGDLPAGSYKAVVFVDSGAEEVVAAQYRLQF